MKPKSQFFVTKRLGAHAEVRLRRLEKQRLAGDLARPTKSATSRSTEATREGALVDLSFFFSEPLLARWSPSGSRSRRRRPETSQVHRETLPRGDVQR